MTTHTLSEERGLQLALTEAQHSALIRERIAYDRGGNVCRLTWATVESFDGNLARAMDYVEGFIDAVSYGWTRAEYDRVSS